MKQGTVILLALILGLTLISQAENRNILIGDQQLRAPANGPVRAVANHLDEIIYFEDWEDGTLADWVPLDLTATGATWHLDSYNAFGGAGTSWWVGDPEVGNNGGYLDDWYMTLNSPSVDLGAAPMLLFWHRYSCEDPAGAEAPYNGWDGCNIRISTNGGTTWNVIETVTPAYTVTSSYAFGFQHGEGPNIPQWCNTTSGTAWHQVTADLSQWANQTVMLRWAFASDPSYSTPNNQSMFGWMVDNIRVYSGTDTVLTHDAEAAEGFVGGTMRPVGGNLWRIGTDATSPNGSHVVLCNNEGTNLYNPDMNTALESPIMDISELTNGLLIADVSIHGEVICNTGEFPDCDYWGIEVSVDEGATWCAISNPTCDPSGTNYVYTDMPPEWALFNDSYTDIMDFSQFLLLADPPESIMFRLTLETNSDANLGFGPKFDGFSLDFQAGFPNDLSCYTLQVKYPTMINRPINIKAYYENIGGQPQAQVPAWYRVTGSTQQRFLPNLQLDPGMTDTRIATLTIPTPGDYEVKAWSALASDQDQTNDTSAAPPQLPVPPEPDDGEVYPINVQDADEDFELGYDHRHVVFRYNYATGQGPLVHFTPAADGIEDEYNLNTVRASFTSVQTGTQPIRFHVYAGDETEPGTEIYNEEIQVAANQTGTNIWKDVDLSALTETRDMTGDFWVWLEVVTTGTDRFPQILGNAEEDWDDVHHYTWTGTGAPTVATAFYQIHALISTTEAVGDNGAVEIPASWSLSQNYPNPFNPTTEIQYAVPRSEHMTLKVFNVVGQEVATLVDGTVNAGMYTVTFDSHGLSSGVYIYRLEADGFTQSHKMLLLK